MLKEKYSPMYFLSALGAGGLSISFFIYLMFLVPHKGFSMPTFAHVADVLMKKNLNSLLVAFVVLFIVMFAYYHFKLLIWNTRQYNAFKQTEAFKVLKTNNTQVTLMAIPLTFTMTINVSFALGVILVPNLWSIVEYLFPFALIAMFAAAYFSLKIFGEYAMRMVTEGGFSFDMNNNLSQLISVFAFSMVAVSFAAPGAMSHHVAVNAVGIGMSIFFIALSILLLIPKLLFGINSMIHNGISEEASPSLWILIPILTLLGIAIVRINMGFMHNFEHDIANISKQLTQTSLFVTTTIIFSIQILVGLSGYFVMKKLNYFKDYVHGDKQSPVSLALICPGVAFTVFGMFFLNYGLVFSGIVPKYTIIYYLLMTPFMFVQFKTVMLFFKLKGKFSL